MATHYEALGVAPDADDAAIKRQYKRLALQFHPDKNQGEGQAAAAETFKRVAEAYSTLSDARRRRDYDVSLPSRPRPGAAARPPP